ncbi:MAG: aminotransferase class III-fold pyridoxal phosphate-dependent enzyme [Aestuariivirga sp.]
MPHDILVAFAKDAYDLTGAWSNLSGERDQNFRVSDDRGAVWLFKLCNPRESAGIFEGQVLALKHIERTDPSLPVPRVRHTKDGLLLAKLHYAGLDHCVIVLSYLAGSVLAAAPLASERLYEVGQLVARLGRALRGFIHTAPATRHLAWDHRNLAELLPHVGLLPEEHRASSEQIISDFCRDHLPTLEKLRCQIIHGDAHPFNTLIDGGSISGIIDFGDMVLGALVQDLSNTLADYLIPGADNQRVMLEITKGYHSITPLEELELDVLLPLMETRILMNPLIQALRSEGGASQSSYQDDCKRAFPLLDEIETERKVFVDVLRRGAALPPISESKPDTVEGLLERRKRVMGKKLYMFYDTPLHLVKGQAVLLKASDGKSYLDCYNNVPHVGHCHPYVIGAIERQMRQLNTNTRYLSEQSIAYAERLTATLDKSLTTVIYVNSGSEANDIAWRMAKAWTGHSGGLAMDFAYHGITDAVDPFSPSNDMANWKFPHMRVITPPDDYRGQFKRGDNNIAQRYADLADAPIAELAQSPHGVAAAMVDSAFMSNGMLDVPHGYLSAVVGKISAAGGLFIADEVQSGFGRMGTAMWGHQHHGVVPDFVTIGKPAGNGHPIGVVITRPEILENFIKTAPFFSTFGGNNVSCAAGIAVLDVIRDEKLIENCKTTGAYMKARLLELKSKFDLIGDVRGVGLALGVELVRDRRTLEPAAAETKRLVNLIRAEGILIGSEGVFGNILKIRPPVVFQPAHVDIAVAALEQAMLKL